MGVIVRGNHEEANTWRAYSFAEEVNRKFLGRAHDKERAEIVCTMFTLFCERLPHAVYMARDPCEDPEPLLCNVPGRGRVADAADAMDAMELVDALKPLRGEWVQCCHGGIEPRFD